MRVPGSPSSWWSPRSSDAPAPPARSSPTRWPQAVLQRAVDAGEAHGAEYLSGLASAGFVGAVALAGSLTAEPDDGRVHVHGALEPVLSAHVAELLVAPVADGWVVLLAGEFEAEERPTVDLTRRVAAVTVDVTVSASRMLRAPTRAEVQDLAALLFAAEAVGASQWCVDASAEYAKERQQFGRPIGQFQGVKHRCANMLARTELARAAVWDAARAVDDADAAPLATASAAALTVDAFFETAKDCVQVHGGIGFTWEHDAHVYLRRAMTVRALIGTSTPWRVRTARARARRRDAAGSRSTCPRAPSRCATTCAGSSRRSTGSTEDAAAARARRRRLPRTAVAVALGSRRRRGRAARDRRRVPRRQGPATRPDDRRRGRCRR